MKITRIDDLHADAGWRNFSFLRIETSDGIVGWSEYTEADGSRGLTAIIRGLSDLVIGQDPHRIQYITSHLASRTIQAPGGVNQRAIAAIENALLDIKGKSLGVPVYDLLGGKVRDRLPVYFSHSGTYRVRNHADIGVPPLRTYDDVAKLGAEVKQRSFKPLNPDCPPLATTTKEHRMDKRDNLPAAGRAQPWQDWMAALSPATSESFVKNNMISDGL
jgi:L-alanine-DL-glutamate epimerase-like enolase superfamily enzyme